MTTENTFKYTKGNLKLLSMATENNEIKEIKLYEKSSITLTVYRNDLNCSKIENVLKIVCLPKQCETLKIWFRKEKSTIPFVYNKIIVGKCTLEKHIDNSGTLSCMISKGTISKIKKHINNSICKIILNLSEITDIEGNCQYALVMTYHPDYATTRKEEGNTKNEISSTNINREKNGKEITEIGTKKTPSRYPPSLYPPKGKKPFTIQIVEGGVSHVQSNGDVLTTQEVKQKLKDKSMGGNSAFFVDVKEKPKQKYHSSSDSPKSKSGANKKRPKNFGGESLTMDRYFT